MPADSNVILRGDKSFVYDLDFTRALYVLGGELVFDRSRPAQSVWMGCDFLSLFLFLIFFIFLSKIGGGVNGGEVLVLMVLSMLSLD